jgi:hypothetical protein
MGTTFLGQQDREIVRTHVHSTLGMIHHNALHGSLTESAIYKTIQPSLMVSELHSLVRDPVKARDKYGLNKDDLLALNSIVDHWEKPYAESAKNKSMDKGKGQKYIVLLDWIGSCV